MSSLFKNFKMDHTKEQNGVEVTPAGANLDGSVPSFTLARMGPMNQKYQKTLERLTAPYKRQLELKTLANEKADLLMQQVFVQSILLGWKNVQDEKGQEIVFSPENALTLFAVLPDLYYELQQQAQSAALFRIDESDAVAKNS